MSDPSLRNFLVAVVIFLIVVEAGTATFMWVLGRLFQPNGTRLFHVGQDLLFACVLLYPVMHPSPWVDRLTVASAVALKLKCDVEGFTVRLLLAGWLYLNFNPIPALETEPWFTVGVVIACMVCVADAALRTAGAWFTRNMIFRHTDPGPGTDISH